MKHFLIAGCVAAAVTACSLNEGPDAVQAAVLAPVLQKGAQQQVDQPWGEVLSALYAEQGKLLWLQRDGAAADARELLEKALQELPKHGIQRQQLAALPAIGMATAEELVKRDLATSRLFLNYAQQVGFGGEQRKAAQQGWEIAPATLPAADWLRRIASGDADAVFSEVPPPHSAYDRLLAERERLIAQLQEPAWQPLSGDSLVRPGERAPEVAALRQRLLSTGDLVEQKSADPELMDEQLVTALKRFQRRHGLEDDGIIGGRSRERLNLSAADRIELLDLNLERLRWLPRELGERHVLVNIAAYHMRLVEAGEVTLHMPVIVGKLEQTTPIFADRMEYIEFNPYWNIPASIAVAEMAPKMVEDPGYLGRKRIELLSGWEKDARILDPRQVDWNAVSAGNWPYRLRQLPGEDNALGTVKFMFPNDHDVYMHDTPADQLFAESRRDFSHGCIRLERPHELALTLLSRQRWDQGDLNEVRASKDRKVVKLDERIPVYIVYLTAWPDPENGQVQFVHDVYQRDAQLARKFRFASPELAATARQRDRNAAPE